MVVKNKTAPEVASTTAGASNRPTEAERIAIPIMAFGRAPFKEPAHGIDLLPLLP